eukprot:10921390-Lingulodinium_polyedra.AAC.1
MEHCPELCPQAKGELWWGKRNQRRQKRLRPGHSGRSAVCRGPSPRLRGWIGRGGARGPTRMRCRRLRLVRVW